MKYDEIREHVRAFFRVWLARFKERTAERGPVDELGEGALRYAQGFAEQDLETWEMLYAEREDGLLALFCQNRGLNEDELTPDDRKVILSELQKGHRAYARAALDHNAGLDDLDLGDGAEQPPEPTEPPEVTPDDGPGYREIVERYFQEATRGGALAATTESSKRDALDLLGRITGDKLPSKFTRADAQKVKEVLLRLPTNRNKSPLTRGLPLEKMLEVAGVQVISSRTVNVYIGAMQTFGNWAVDNGYAAENVFTGMRVKVSKRAQEQGRVAFSTDQLRTLFEHLTENPGGLVNKDTHKWGVLIGIFTGMRLNEIAQLRVDDVVCVDGTWVIDVNDEGDANKSLKTASSHRRVPVHERLLECGFLDFVDQQRAGASGRLFPDLTYSRQNGYGRNLGRWFNERLLPALGMEAPGLVYHSLRHTMVTRLAQSDAPSEQVKAIVGHAQAGVTFNTYFKAGFLPAQLKAVIDLFDF
ncbi:MAG: site-specific integrase [Rhizobiaceae bacterium]|nr:site-specific integrase [Rhizobiaceae bacterium]